MSRRKRQAWGVGTYFKVPLDDGSYACGQVISEVQTLSGSVCIFFAHRFDHQLSVQEQLAWAEPIAALLVTKDLLDWSRWEVVGKGRIIDANRFFDLESFKKSKFVGARIIGSGIVEKLLNACFGLYPWDGFHDPTYLDRVLPRFHGLLG
jgi:hypothetical protein